MKRLRLAAWVLLVPCGLSCSPKPSPPAPVSDPTGIHNLHELDGRLISGSNPEGDEAFVYLASRGVTHIVSVDGAKPDVEGARRHGITYIHIPVGYDGIDRERQLRLARAAELPGPLFIHCHHGKHRGPSAAAIVQRCRMSTVTPEQSAAFLKLAGTDPRYEGLYDTVKAFRPPTAAEMAGVPETLPESVDVGGMTALMVAVDEEWDRLKRMKADDWRKPDPAPVVQLIEHYREAGRLSPAMREAFGQAESHARLLEKALRAGDPSGANTTFDRSSAHCATCHRAHRDKRQ